MTSFRQITYEAEFYNAARLMNEMLSTFHNTDVTPAQYESMIACQLFLKDMLHKQMFPGQQDEKSNA